MLHQFCNMLASCPSLRCSFRKKHLSHAEKQSVWSHNCGLQNVLKYCDCALGCAMRLAANQRTLVEIELLATMGWKWGCQPFSCRCSQNVMHCRKEICSTCLFQESIPAIPLGNAKHPIHTRSLSFLRAAACSTGSALWLHHAHCNCRKSLSYAESGASSLSPTYVPKM